MQRHTRHMRWALVALAACSGVGACGVQEHEGEQKVVEGPKGPIFKPPPLSTGGQTSGGAPAAAGSGTNGGAGGSGNAGGASGAAQGATGGSAGSSATGGRASTGGSGGAASGAGGNAAAGSAGSAGSAAGSSATGGSGGSSSGVMVDINGTLLPKENVIAFVHIGHSNMAGRASKPSGSRPYHFTDMNLYAWMYHQGSWQPALEPGTAGDDGNSFMGMATGGPGTALMKQAAERSPNHYFVSLGYGKGSAYCSQFLKGGLFYDTMMLNALALKGKVTFGAIVIMLGITERHGTSADINGYASCINTLTTQIRSDLGEKDLPMLINNYEQGATGAELSPTGTFARQIIPQIDMIPSVVANSALVDTAGLSMQDDHHFDLDGQKEWSKRVLDIMQEKGWFPWSSP